MIAIFLLFMLLVSIGVRLDFFGLMGMELGYRNLGLIAPRPRRSDGCQFSERLHLLRDLPSFLCRLCWFRSQNRYRHRLLGLGIRGEDLPWALWFPFPLDAILEVLF